MLCYTYNNGNLTEGWQLAGKNQKTCAFTLKIPVDWDVNEFQNRLINQTFCDTTLHCVAMLCEGDSVNSVFPAGCVALVSNDPVHMDNINNSCTIIAADGDSVTYVLFDQSCLYDTRNSQFIYKQI